MKNTRNSNNDSNNNQEVNSYTKEELVGFGLPEDKTSFLEGVQKTALIDALLNNNTEQAKQLVSQDQGTLYLKHSKGNNYALPNALYLSIFLSNSQFTEYLLNLSRRDELLNQSIGNFRGGYANAVYLACYMGDVKIIKLLEEKIGRDEFLKLAAVVIKSQTDRFSQTNGLICFFAEAKPRSDLTEAELAGFFYLFDNYPELHILPATIIDGLSCAAESILYAAVISGCEKAVSGILAREQGKTLALNSSEGLANIVFCAAFYRSVKEIEVLEKALGEELFLNLAGRKNEMQGGLYINALVRAMIANKIDTFNYLFKKYPQLHVMKHHDGRAVNILGYAIGNSNEFAARNNSELMKQMQDDCLEIISVILQANKEVVSNLYYSNFRDKKNAWELCHDNSVDILKLFIKHGFWGAASKNEPNKTRLISIVNYLKPLVKYVQGEVDALIETLAGQNKGGLVSELIKILNQVIWIPQTHKDNFKRQVEEHNNQVLDALGVIYHDVLPDECPLSISINLLNSSATNSLNNFNINEAQKQQTLEFYEKNVNSIESLVNTFEDKNKRNNLINIIMLAKPVYVEDFLDKLKKLIAYRPVIQEAINYIESSICFGTQQFLHSLYLKVCSLKSNFTNEDKEIGVGSDKNQSEITNFWEPKPTLKRKLDSVDKIVEGNKEDNNNNNKKANTSNSSNSQYSFNRLNNVVSYNQNENSNSNSNSKFSSSTILSSSNNFNSENNNNNISPLDEDFEMPINDNNYNTLNLSNTRNLNNNNNDSNNNGQNNHFRIQISNQNRYQSPNNNNEMSRGG